MDDQQRRYLTLDGDPVHAGLKDRILQRSEVQAGALVTAFTAAIASQGSFEHLLTTAGFAGLGALVACGFASTARRIQIRDVFGEAASVLCIDKVPDRNTPPTSPENRENATEIYRWNATAAFGLPAVFALWAPMLASPLYNYIATGETTIPATMNAGIFMTSLGVGVMTTALRTFKNYYNVAAQKWAITDMPKPVAQEEKAPTRGIFAPN